MSEELVAALRRSARRHGWDDSPPNRLSYYNLRFVRPEPGARQSVILIRAKHKIVDVQVEIGGLRQQPTLPSRQRVEELLATPVPHPRLSDTDFEPLATAVDNWESGLDHHGDNLARAAAKLLRKVKGDNDV